MNSLFFSLKKVSSIRSSSLLLQSRNYSIDILCVGKKSGGEEWISEGSHEYEKRLKNKIKITTTILKSNDDLLSTYKKMKENNSKNKFLALDERGKTLSSVKFKDILYSKLNENNRVTFIIGCFDGLPKEIKEKEELLSLSSLTFTHSMARLLLVEQIYRASEMNKGSSYHKD